MNIKRWWGANEITWDHNYLLLGLLLGEHFLKYSLKSFQKVLQLNFLIYYYVKVYVKDFKIYVIFKSFEVYL